MTLRGALASMTPWTPDEDAALREVYPAGGVKAALAALPGRSANSVRIHANRLGLRTREWWKEDEDRTLRNLADDGRTLRYIAKALGRSRRGIEQRATELGVSLGVPPGYETLTRSARRTGLCVATLRRVLEAQGVLLHRRRHSNRHSTRPQHYVEPCDVDDAIEAWCRTEPVAAAARRAGVGVVALRKRLRAIGVAAPRRRHLRVTEEQVAAALNAQRAGSTDLTGDCSVPTTVCMTQRAA